MSRRLYTLGALVLFLVYAAFLAWREWGFREGLASPLAFTATVATPPSRAPLNTAAVATVLGLTAENTLLPSAEPLTLHASFLRASGLSKALLADAQGARIYQVGDQLPGGSVLRRVEVNQAVLWNKGREEVLALRSSAAPFLRVFDAQAEAQTNAIPARYLRPHAGQSK